MVARAHGGVSRPQSNAGPFARRGRPTATPHAPARLGFFHSRRGGLAHLLRAGRPARGGRRAARRPAASGAVLRPPALRGDAVTREREPALRSRRSSYSRARTVAQVSMRKCVRFEKGPNERRRHGAGGTGQDPRLSPRASPPRAGARTAPSPRTAPAAAPRPPPRPSLLAPILAVQTRSPVL